MVKTELLPKVIRISCSNDTPRQMFCSPAVRKSVTIKQSIPSCRQKRKLCCWSSKWSRKRTTHRAKFLFPCFHVHGNEPESKARSLLRARFPFPPKFPFLACTNPPSIPHLHTSSGFHVPSTVLNTENTPKHLFAHSLHHTVTLPNSALISALGTLRSPPLHTTALDTAQRETQGTIPF